MKQLVIVSGKGGTGKTSIAAGIAHLAAQTHAIVIADTDVDAANMALVLSPTHIETHTFTGSKVAVIDSYRCTSCGICEEICRFDAVKEGSVYTVDKLACEGCAACYYECPVSAISMEQQQAGSWTISQTQYGPLIHAHLNAGQENSGKLVTLVKNIARQRALDSDVDFLLVDGPPGIGCPVIASIAGTDVILIVTEPSVAGAHDMERIVGLAEHFHIPAVVLVNKADLNAKQGDVITEYCTTHGVQVVGRIPYHLSVTENMVRGLPMTTVDSPVTVALKQTWKRIQSEIEQL